MNQLFIYTIMPSIKLTKRQQEVLHYLKETHRIEGFMPSTRDIQRHFDFASQTAAMSHLRALERKGVIVRKANKACGIGFPEEMGREEIVNIPIYGSIAAGMAQDVESEREGCLSIDVSSLGVKGNARTFALKVKGESMINAHICDGDTVVMEFREPRRDDIVAALIDGETTLKRYVIEEGKAFLRAENEDFPDLIPARELIIQGVLIAVLRSAA